MSTGIAHAPIHLGLLIQVLFAAEHLSLRQAIAEGLSRQQGQKLMVLVALQPILAALPVLVLGRHAGTDVHI